MREDKSLFVSVREAAYQLQCSEGKVRSMLRTSELPSIKIGKGSRRIPREGIEKLVTEALGEQMRD